MTYGASALVDGHKEAIGRTEQPSLGNRRDQQLRSAQQEEETRVAPHRPPRHITGYSRVVLQTETAPISNILPVFHVAIIDLT